MSGLAGDMRAKIMFELIAGLNEIAMNLLKPCLD